ncbi:MAG: hypothetical protein AAGM22_09010 [Acidobacteriota bacterium]
MRFKKLMWILLACAGLSMAAVAGAEAEVDTEAEAPAPGGLETEIVSAQALEGSWQLEETEVEKEQRSQAITQATRSLSRAVQARARQRLNQRVAPRDEVTIDFEGEVVALTVGREAVELELGGEAVEVKGDGGKALMSAQMDGPRLVIEVRGQRGQRTTTYAATDDRLRVEMSMVTSRLSLPVEFSSSYARSD